ncbi:hypothetical protein P3L10_025645 [Capsicum annuum]
MQNTDNPGRVANANDDDLRDDDLIALVNWRRAENIVAPVNQNRPVRKRENHQPTVQFAYDYEDDTDFGEAGATGAIIPPLLAPGI